MEIKIIFGTTLREARTEALRNHKKLGDVITLPWVRIGEIESYKVFARYGRSVSVLPPSWQFQIELDHSRLQHGGYDSIDAALRGALNYYIENKNTISIKERQLAEKVKVEPATFSIILGGNSGIGLRVLAHLIKCGLEGVTVPVQVSDSALLAPVNSLPEFSKDVADFLKTPPSIRIMRLPFQAKEVGESILVGPDRKISTAPRITLDDINLRASTMFTVSDLTASKEVAKKDDEYNLTVSDLYITERYETRAITNRAAFDSSTDETIAQTSHTILNTKEAERLMLRLMKKGPKYKLGAGKMYSFRENTVVARNVSRHSSHVVLEVKAVEKQGIPLETVDMVITSTVKPLCGFYVDSTGVVKAITNPNANFRLDNHRVINQLMAKDFIKEYGNTRNRLTFVSNDTVYLIPEKLIVARFTETNEVIVHRQGSNLADVTVNVHGFYVDFDGNIKAVLDPKHAFTKENVPVINDFSEIQYVVEKFGTLVRDFTGKLNTLYPVNPDKVIGRYINDKTNKIRVSYAKDSSFAGYKKPVIVKKSNIEQPLFMKKDPEAKKEHKCCGCSATKVRLYRPYGSFFRPAELKCNACVTAEQRGYYVPYIPSEDGTAWGYLSTSQYDKNADGKSDVDRFYELPEKNPNGVKWETEGGWSDSLQNSNKAKK